jgi:hypothetical protein
MKVIPETCHALNLISTFLLQYAVKDVLLNQLNYLNKVNSYSLYISGYYMYLEASSKRPGSKAILNSQINGPTPSTGYCFIFWYHMYGPQIGRLSVSIQSQGRNIVRWTKSGTQGNKWQQASFTFTSSVDYQVNILLIIVHCIELNYCFVFYIRRLKIDSS